MLAEITGITCQLLLIAMQTVFHKLPHFQLHSDCEVTLALVGCCVMSGKLLDSRVQK